nr:proline-rich receptor-like protein kinase PERK8 [Aegilops tauschii subsp. strangulata]
MEAATPPPRSTSQTTLAAPQKMHQPAPPPKLHQPASPSSPTVANETAYQQEPPPPSIATASQPDDGLQPAASQPAWPGGQIWSSLPRQASPPLMSATQFEPAQRCRECTLAARPPTVAPTATPRSG